MEASNTDRLAKAALAVSIAGALAQIISLAGLFYGPEDIRLALAPYRELILGLSIPVALVVGVALALGLPHSRGFIFAKVRAFGQLLKRFYVSMLSHLVVRPASDHWNLVVRPEAEAPQPSEPAGLDDAIADLTDDAMQVLEAILSAYDAISGSPLEIAPRNIVLYPPPTPDGDEERRVPLACDELKMRRIISDRQSSPTSAGLNILVELDNRVRALSVSWVTEKVESELYRRGIPVARHRRYQDYLARR